MTSNDVVALDSKCLNCQNNANGLDRAVIFQFFKIACLRYKPQPVTFKDKTVMRMDLLKQKQQLIEQMELEQVKHQSQSRVVFEHKLVQSALNKHII